MTREEQLQFCRVCKNKKRDIYKGIICSLTGEQGCFDVACPNYEEDIVEAQKAKVVAEERQRQYQEEASVSGWLAWFLWVGVGGGAVARVITTILSNKDNFLSPLGLLMILLYLICYLAIAILTIKAFYKKESNAVSLARTYVGLVVVDLIAGLIVSYTLDDFSEIYKDLRSVVWVGIWMTYLSMSSRVENIIPRATRTWQKAEKMILSVFIVVCFTMCAAVYYSTKYPLSGIFYSKVAVVEAFIKEVNKELPDYSDPEMTYVKVTKENFKLVYVYQLNNYTQGDMTWWEMVALIDKQSMLYEVANGHDEENQEFMKLLFNDGYEVCYRCLDSNGVMLYEYEINGDDYNNALTAGVNFKCDDEAYNKLLEYYNSMCPSEYIGGTQLKGIRHINNTLSYEMNLPPYADLGVVDRNFMENFLRENWANLSDQLKTFSLINKEDIIYRVYTADGMEHCVVVFTYKECLSLNQQD